MAKNVFFVFFVKVGNINDFTDFTAFANSTDCQSLVVSTILMALKSVTLTTVSGSEVDELSVFSHTSC